MTKNEYKPRVDDRFAWWRVQAAVRSQTLYDDREEQEKNKNGWWQTLVAILLIAVALYLFLVGLGIVPMP